MHDPFLDDDFPERELRETVDQGTIIVCQELGLLNARLRNASANGCSGETSEPLRIGSRITLLSSCSTRVDAQVRWALGTRFGLRLER